MKNTGLSRQPHTYIHSIRSLGAWGCDRCHLWAVELVWCVCVCHPSLHCDFDWSEQLTGLKKPKNISPSLSPIISSFFSLSRLKCRLCSLSFPRFFLLLFSRLALLQLSLTHLPSSTHSALMSHISGSMGTCTTSTCSSADVCINHIDGPVVLGDLKAKVHVSHTHSHFFTPTSELVDSGLLCHVGEGDDTLWKVTRWLIHFYESMRTHVATGIVRYVDSITACALKKNGLHSSIHFRKYDA